MDRIITLTTDFGTRDGYVGIIKGVILGINPRATIVDITHDITPQNVEEGAFLFAAAAPYFPPGTIHVVVVDPGVGTARRPIALQSGETIYLAPDNGVLTNAIFGNARSLPPLAGRLPGLIHRGFPIPNALLAAFAANFKIIHLNRPAYWLPRVSNTFHGRDIFAPCAAHLSLGVPLEALGDRVAGLNWLGMASGFVGQTAMGRVVHIDRFGNCITSIPGALLPSADYARCTVMIRGATLQGLKRTYSDVQQGQPLVLIGSTSYLEIAVREGSAAAQLEIRLGDPVSVTLNE